MEAVRGAAGNEAKTASITSLVQRALTAAALLTDAWPRDYSSGSRWLMGAGYRSPAVCGTGTDR